MSRYNHNEQDRVTGKAHLVTSLLAKADECNKALWTTIKKQPLVPFVCNERLKRKLDSVKLVVCLCSTSLSLLHI